MISRDSLVLRNRLQIPTPCASTFVCSLFLVYAVFVRFALRTVVGLSSRWSTRRPTVCAALHVVPLIARYFPLPRPR